MSDMEDDIIIKQAAVDAELLTTVPPSRATSRFVDAIQSAESRSWTTNGMPD